MAKKPATFGAKKKAAGGNMAARGMILASLVISVPFLLPTMTLLMFGLAPTVVAAISERGENRYAWLCVGGCNLAGLSPYLFSLWLTGHTLSNAVDILLDVVALLVIYGAEAGGWMLYVALPPVASAFMGIADQRRVQTLRAIQRRLVEEWGPEIVKAAREQIDAERPPAPPEG